MSCSLMVPWGIIKAIYHLRTMKMALMLSLGVSIAVVYILVHLIEWPTDSRKAITMTEELRAYQHRA